MTRAYVLCAIVFCEALLIAYLGISLYRKAQTSDTAVHPLNKSGFVLSPTAELLHFFEPKPSTVLTNKPDWAPESANIINADTLHDRFTYTHEKPANTYRIIALGDSMTFGLYLDTEDNWTERLEDTLNAECANRRYEVINLGVGGYDIRYTLERFQRRGAAYQPDLVVWFVSNRNFTVPVDIYYQLYDYFNYSGASVERQALEAEQRVDIQTNRDEILAYEFAALERFFALYQGPSLFFSAPSLLSSSLRTQLVALAEKAGGSFIEVGNLIDSRYTVREGDAHPNALGSERLADELFIHLTAKQLVPC